MTGKITSTGPQSSAQSSHGARLPYTGRSHKRVGPGNTACCCCMVARNSSATQGTSAVSTPVSSNAFQYQHADSECNTPHLSFLPLRAMSSSSVGPQLLLHHTGYDAICFEADAGPRAPKNGRGGTERCRYDAAACGGGGLPRDAQLSLCLSAVRVPLNAACLLSFYVQKTIFVPGVRRLNAPPGVRIPPPDRYGMR